MVGLSVLVLDPHDFQPIPLPSRLSRAEVAGEPGHFAFLQDLVQLREFRVIDSAAYVGASSVRDLRGHPRLRTLCFRHCGFIDDAALSHLRRLPALRDLAVIRSAISDEGLACHVALLTALTRLDLSRSPHITDSGLAPLRALLALRVLDVSACSKITAAGISHLDKLRPGLTIL